MADPGPIYLLIPKCRCNGARSRLRLFISLEKLQLRHSFVSQGLAHPLSHNASLFFITHSAQSLFMFSTQIAVHLITRMLLIKHWALFYWTVCLLFSPEKGAEIIHPCMHTIYVSLVVLFEIKPNEWIKRICNGGCFKVKEKQSGRSFCSIYLSVSFWFFSNSRNKFIA